MLLKTFILFNLIISNYAYINPPISPISPFSNWHCIDFVKNIDKSKPYAFNVGELPLVAWFSKNTSATTNVNICRHIGSKLIFSND